MQRQIWFIIFAVGGLALIACGLLMPAHLRALDASVVERVTPAPSVVNAAWSLAALEKIGPARLLLDMAQIEALEGREKLAEYLEHFAEAHPELSVWGGADPFLEQIFGRDVNLRHEESRPVLELFLRRPHREAVVDFLRTSRRPVVQEVLKHRSLTNTVHFPPVMSASGQALDATIALTGLLLQGDHLSPKLRETVQPLVFAANQEGNVQGIEHVYLDLMSLGKRFDWAQLTELVREVEDLPTLRTMAHLARGADEQLPVLFASVHLSGRPAAVAEYLMRFGETGFNDLSYSLRGGRGGVMELLDRQLRIYYPGMRERVVMYDPFGAFFYGTVDLSRSAPSVALGLKYLFFLAGGFLMARSVKYWREPSELTEAMTVKPIQMARQGLFAVCFVFLAILVWEPFLAQGSQLMQLPMRLQITFANVPAPTEITDTFKRMENPITVLALILFLTVQIVIYVVCLLKLAEIRRQPMESQLKLKLLDNEENMFDAGLYCGLAGTVAALVLLAMGIIKPSLMAAYASTLFGIVFVAVLKIFHVRPLRRSLIVDSEVENS
jgi:hypothetical protein